MLLEIGMLCPFRMFIVLMIVFILCFILESFVLLVIILRIHSSGESQEKKTNRKESAEKDEQ